ncbi:hypothetical protein F4859DRAFT_477582 [Xylaria cf. heliscus]|nr:hypothetical protein F4859DRAFT_477582 [Xylaria cf. heliscus]
MSRGKTCIIKSHGNPLSRVATLAACRQKDFECFILPPDPCYLYVADTLKENPPMGASVVLNC